MMEERLKTGTVVEERLDMTLAGSHTKRWCSKDERNGGTVVATLG